jgi:hypothetical protein
MRGCVNMQMDYTRHFHIFTFPHFHIFTLTLYGKSSKDRD